jgi:hypothetical protein
MCRDDEIQRLISYIRGLGLKVTFTSKDVDASALWYLDNSEIVICKSQNKSKIEIVLSLLHECGHAIHNIHEKNRQVDTKFESALDQVEKAEESEVESKKKHRKIILDNEIAGTNYWHSIYKETNMKFPIWKLDAQMEYDIYQYQVFYETGSVPSFKERRKKFKEIKDRHRRKNG